MEENIRNQEIIKGKERLYEYLLSLEKSCKDYTDIKFSYENACAELKNVFERADEFIKYNNDIITSELQSAFQIGFNQSLKLDLPAFADCNYDDILDESELHISDGYLAAYSKRNTMIENLSDEAKPLWDAIVEYNSFLKTYIPKMAHYYGYAAGNGTLNTASKIYQANCSFINSYKEWLCEYLDCAL